MESFCWERVGNNFLLNGGELDAGYPFELAMLRAITSFLDFNGYIQISLDLSIADELTYRFKDCFVLASHVQIKIPAGLPLHLKGSEKIVLKARPVAEMELATIEKFDLLENTEIKAVSFLKESDHYKLVLKKPVNKRRQWYVSDENFQITAIF
jgi:hypothetical protein